MRTLYHFTCDDGLAAIAADGYRLRPNGAPGWPVAIWLTDLPAPSRAALGLTKRILTCDRMAHRLTVIDADDQCMTWSKFCRANKISRHIRDDLEGAPGAAPAHWWVSTEHLTAQAPALV